MKVVGLYHPSHHVPDLDEAEDFFARVFGRSSTRLSTLSHKTPPDGFRNDYATFTPIADVLFDSIDPTRYVVAGRHPYDPVDRPTLKGLGWYVEDVGDLYRRLRAHGFTVLDQLDREAIGEDPPTAVGSPMPLCFTVPAETGLRHELLPPIPFPLDHRQAEGWRRGIVKPEDPLGIIRCRSHTVRSTDPKRGVRFVTKCLDGAVVRTGRDDLLDTEATWVELADTTIQYVADATADPTQDDYCSIEFDVVDLAKVEAHLRATGVTVVARTADALVTDPLTSLGVAWRFSAGPNPPRAST